MSKPKTQTYMHNEESYNDNSNFKDYVDKYSKNYKIPTEEALSHAVVTEVRKHYEGGR